MNRKSSLRAVAAKWLPLSGAAAAQVMRFGRTEGGRVPYVRIGVRDGRLSIVFFRHRDGSWNVFPPLA